MLSSASFVYKLCNYSSKNYKLFVLKVSFMVANRKVLVYLVLHYVPKMPQFDQTDGKLRSEIPESKSSGKADFRVMNTGIYVYGQDMYFVSFS